MWQVLSMESHEKLFEKLTAKNRSYSAKNLTIGTQHGHVYRRWPRKTRILETEKFGGYEAWKSYMNEWIELIRMTYMMGLDRSWHQLRFLGLGLFSKSQQLFTWYSEYFETLTLLSLLVLPVFQFYNTTN